MSAVGDADPSTFQNWKSFANSGNMRCGDSIETITMDTSGTISTPSRSKTWTVGRAVVLLGWAVLVVQYYRASSDAFHDPVGNEMFWYWVELFTANLLVATLYFFPGLRFRYG